MPQGVESFGDPQQRFRMPDKEITPRLEKVLIACKEALLGRLIEVDDHVPAEDDIELEPRTERPAIVQQIDLPKRDVIAQFLLNPHKVGLFPRAAEKVAV